MSVNSLPMIQVNTPVRTQRHSLPKNIQDLLNQVRQLKEDTESLVCDCNQPDCPFQKSESFDIQRIECSLDLLSDSQRMRRKAIQSNIHPVGLKPSTSLKGIERRGDGTIVERDGPRSISSEDSLEKRLRRSYMNNSSSFIGQHLSVTNTLSDSEDCLVDSDNLFGTSSDDDSTFSRFEMSRKQVRRHNSPKSQRRRATMNGTTYTLVRVNSQGLSRQIRSAVSLPTCVYIEDDEMSLSTCSSASSISNSASHYTRQHISLCNGFVIAQ